MIFLDKEQIVFVNTDLVSRYNLDNSGAGRIVNATSLAYLEDIPCTLDYLFSEYECTSDIEKVAVVASQYFYKIITNHIFLDGNKRTGFICAMTFIRLNGYSIDQIDPDQNEDNYVNLALSVINRSKGIPEVIKWFGSRIYS